MSDPLLNWRNQLFHHIVTALSRVLPTREYVVCSRGLIEYGMRSAARDQAEGRPAPPDWRTT